MAKSKSKKSAPKAKAEAPKVEEVIAEFEKAAVVEAPKAAAKLCIADLKESCAGSSSLIKKYIKQLTAEGVHTSNLEGAVRDIDRVNKRLKATTKQY